jgi:hypothetical protein
MISKQKTTQTTNHKPLFVVCDYITNCVCDFEMRPVQSVKIKEGIGKWKHQQKISNELLQEFLQAEDLMQIILSMMMTA